MSKRSDKTCKRFKTSSVLKKLFVTNWLSGARVHVDAWIHKDHIHWSYEAQPQFADAVEEEICQSFEEFHKDSAPEFAATMFSDAQITEIKHFVLSLQKSEKQ